MQIVYWVIWKGDLQEVPYDHQVHPYSVCENRYNF